jgi:Na+-driven multidrug efflux pump
VRALRLAAAIFCYVPIALAALALHWGIVGVWAGLDALIGVRCASVCWRFARRRWIVLGTSHPSRR